MSPALPAGRVVVGRVGRAHGIHGLVTVEVRTDDPEGRFAPGALLHTSSSRREVEVRHARPHAGRLLVSFVGVTDRAAAEQLRGALLTADVAHDGPSPDPEEFGDHQLVGLQAVTVAGEALGSVTEVVHLPGQELLAVEGNGREVLVPFVRAIVVAVELGQGRLVVDPPAGLLALNSGRESAASGSPSGDSPGRPEPGGG